jgi:hypothetical protein
MTLDPRSGFSTPADRADLVKGWISTLGGLGADTAPFADERDQLAKVNTLIKHARTFNDARQVGADQAIIRLAAHPGTFEDALTLLTAVTHGTTPEQHAAALDILTRATSRAQAKVVTIFTYRGANLLDILRPIHDRTVEQMNVRAEQIPTTVTTLDDAARAGVSEAWLALEEADAQLNEVHRLVCEWYANAVLPHTGRRPLKTMLPVELFYAEPFLAAELTAAAGQTSIPRRVLRARINRDAKATLRTTAQADANGPLANIDAPENRAHLEALHEEIRAEWGPHTRARR